MRWGSYPVLGRGPEDPDWRIAYFRAQSDVEALRIARKRFPDWEWTHVSSRGGWG